MASRRAGRRPPRIVPGLHPVREVLRAGTDVAEIHIDPSRRQSPVLGEIRDLARRSGSAVVDSDRHQLDDLAGGVTHQGVVAVAAPYRYHDVDDVVAAVPPRQPPLLVALDGVTDPHNFGSVARTAEAVGAHGLLVPARRAVGVTPAAEKAAAGALAYLPVAQVTNLVRTLTALAVRPVWSVGLDTGGDLSIFDCELLAEPVVIVVGAEGRGLSRLVADTCDQLAAVPMRGRVASLNASVAAAVALYEARRRRG
ncbi:MAG: 23S rRNA (guanosine(2251)-2'-O)-methyltransferase RlmB [Actinobacteria bacterium]|nr:23S rRNA (guanosine(2251)-2'-O)-methyltransferase RlmB [Actinomycetota bacterium]